MTTIPAIGRQVDIGEQIRWKGAQSDVRKPEPRTVEKIIQTRDYTEIEAKGPHDGQARFRVAADGTTQAWYGKGENEESMGSVVAAELVDKDLHAGSWKT